MELINLSPDLDVRTNEEGNAKLAEGLIIKNGTVKSIAGDQAIVIDNDDKKQKLILADWLEAM